MNKLAHLVYELTNGKDITYPAGLSELERAALADAAPLLRLPPQDLSKVLALQPDWLGGLIVAYS
jgi:hypothetical protein